MLLGPFGDLQAADRRMAPIYFSGGSGENMPMDTMKSQPPLIILDGALGTELTRRGVNTTLPLWSAKALIDAPEVVAQIHRDYVNAGAQVITTNTFRTNRRVLERAGLGDRMRELTTTAVQLAHQARSPGIRVAGSLAPVEDCYTPALVPDTATLASEHNELAGYLAEAGCDLILVETMNMIREAVAATQAAARSGLPVWVSFTLNASNTLISGETLRDAVQAVLPFGPKAILVNCIPVAQVASAVRELRVILPDTPDAIQIGAYGNVGHVDETVGWTLTHAVSPTQYAQAAHEWREIGASIIGGCCGTTPAHVEKLSHHHRQKDNVLTRAQHQ